MNEKQCIKCLFIRNIERFEFRPSLNTYRNTCKDCRNNKNKYNRINPPSPKLKQTIDFVTNQANCLICLLIKPLNEFDFRKDNNKYRTNCKSCRKLKGLEYNKKNREKQRLYSEKKRRENPEHEKAIAKKSILKHKNKRNAECRKFYLNNKEYCKQKSKEFYIKNPNWRKEYTNKNRERINKYNRELIKRKCKEDPIYHIRKNIRGRFKRALGGNYKKGSAIQALGCSIQFLKSYLETKFLDGMTWNNYGKYGWHIDHIIPLSKFDLTDIDEINKACHYTNLQPLWASDNIRKGNKILS